MTAAAAAPLLALTQETPAVTLLVRVADPAPHPTVTEEEFTAATAAATATRVLRRTLWHLGPDPKDPDPEDPAMIWRRVGSAITCEHHNRIIDKIERWGHRESWLITEEHHDVTGRIYTLDGTELLPHWQPSGPALLRTADNSSHWIPIRELHPWHHMCPIAVSDAPVPEDWSQPSKPLHQKEEIPWVHFTTTHGPFNYKEVLPKARAPRYTTPAMAAFTGLQTPSSAEIATAVVRYIQRNGLMPPPPLNPIPQGVHPDDTLAALLGTREPFPLARLQELLKPHIGELV